MLVSGILTSTMFFAAIAPAAALKMMFGADLAGSHLEIIVRNWGALIGIVGLSLVYGAFNEQARKLALYIAVVSKTVYISLFLIFGREYLTTVAGTLVFDFVLVILFVIYLAGDKKSRIAI